MKNVERRVGNRVYHRRGMQPQRRVTVPVDGRLSAEHVDVIIKLYELDRLNVADIARLYGVSHNLICNKLTYERKREGKPEDAYTKRRRVYGQALGLLEETGLSYREIADKTGLTHVVVRRIALRNGLGRK